MVIGSAVPVREDTVGVLLEVSARLDHGCPGGDVDQGLDLGDGVDIGVLLNFQCCKLELGRCTVVVSASLSSVTSETIS